MVYNRFNINIILRCSLLAATSFLIAIYYTNRGIDLALILLIVIFALEITYLIRYVDRTNDILSNFLGAIRNEDSSLVFSEESGSRSFDELHKGLNQLNMKLKDARMKIIVQEKFFEAVVENTTTPIIAYESSGIVQLANTSVKNLCTISNLHNIDQLQRASKQLKTMLLEIKPGSKKTVHLMLNGAPAYLSLKAVQLSMGRKEVMLVAINDISQELESQETDSWQKLIRILNHEIMNSVAPITSISSTLSGYYRKKGKQIKSADLTEKTITDTLKGLAVIEDHGNGLMNFVDSYRSISKLPRPVLKEARLTNIFESVTLLAASLMPVNKEGKREKVPIVRILDHENMAVMADEELLVRVLFNLVKNAIEALDGKKDSEIILEAGRHISGRVFITVTDNGPGINEDIRDKVFIPFYTTKQGGNGIGLSLSKQIINIHKGKMALQSEPGKGTTITMLI